MDNFHVVFSQVQKSYDGKSLVVKDLNLNINEGEFLTMLGPSGSGKTTSLMMLAGFETPTGGEIFVKNQPISDIPAASPRNRHGFPKLCPISTHDGIGKSLFSAASTAIIGGGD